MSKRKRSTPPKEDTGPPPASPSPEAPVVASSTSSSSSSLSEKRERLGVFMEYLPRTLTNESRVQLGHTSELEMHKANILYRLSSQRVPGVYLFAFGLVRISWSSLTRFYPLLSLLIPIIFFMLILSL